MASSMKVVIAVSPNFLVHIRIIKGAVYAERSGNNRWMESWKGKTYTCSTKDVILNYGGRSEFLGEC